MTFREALAQYYHRPLGHIAKYPAYIKASFESLPTYPQFNPDRLQLKKALRVAEKLVIDAQLLAWQSSQGNDERYKISWNDLYLDSDKPKISDKEVNRQV